MSDVAFSGSYSYGATSSRQYFIFGIMWFAISTLSK